MKKIKILIMIFIILIISLTLILLIINSNNNKVVELPNNNDDVIVNQEEYKLTEEEKKEFEIQYNTANNNKLRELSDEKNYFYVKAILDKYFLECKNLQLNDSDIILPRVGLENIDTKTYIEEQKKQLQELSQNTLLKILGTEYINEFGITKTNITNKLGINYSYEYFIDNILMSENNNRILTFVISGTIINTETLKQNDFKTIIIIDSQNKSYYIYPQEYINKHNYNNLKVDNKLNLGIEYIENNIFNKYEYQNVSDEKICKAYFESLRNRILYSPDSLYNILYSEYAKRRFKNIEDFRNYANENKEFFLNSKLIAFKIVEIGTQKEYICIDQYNNYYIFKRTGGLLNYSILLDDYTVMEGSEIISYSRLNQTNKAQYNLVKFIKMINHKDYNAIYNILNSEFRNSNFKSVNDLKTYIKNNFYDINEVKFEKMEEKENYYIFKCKLTNQINTKETKVVNIIIGKTDNINFEMSFSFE